MNISRTLLLLALVAIALWLTFTPAPGFNSRDNATQPEQASQSSSNPRPAIGASSRALNTPNASALAQGRRQYLDEVIAKLDRSVSIAMADAIATEVNEEFADLIYRLNLSERRKVELSEALIVAYTEIRVISTAMEQGDLTEEELSRIRNPNHVLDKAAELMDASELLQLEEVLENRARTDFDLASISQLEVALPELTSGSRELLLETLFNETYALTSPDGLAMSAGVSSYLDLQIQALSNARLTLASSFSNEEMAIVKDYLAEKESAIAGAAIIFDR